MAYFDQIHLSLHCYKYKGEPVYDSLAILEVYRAACLQNFGKAHFILLTSKIITQEFSFSQGAELTRAAIQ